MDLDLDDESFINNVDDSFLVIKSDAMDDEVVNILKKWNTTAQKNNKSNDEQNNSYINSRTFTRPKKSLSKHLPDNERVPMTEAKINSINLQVGGPISSHSVLMKKSWLGDVSPPNSMDTFNQESIMRSLITSSDFSNISGFLLNDEHDVDKTITPRNVPVRNATFRLSNAKRSGNSTFCIDVETPMKEYGVENVDMELNRSTDDLAKDLTFDMLTLRDMNATIVQSTPINSTDANSRDNRNPIIDMNNLTPINPQNSVEEDEEDEVVPLRHFLSKRLREAETKRESLEDQYEFLLNEETIKLSARVCGSQEKDLNKALPNSVNSDEQEFDKMLDTFCVEIPQSVVANAQKTQLMKDLHERYPLKGSDRRKYEIDIEPDQPANTNHISNDRLLSRGRQYDDFMAQQIANETNVVVASDSTTSNDLAKPTPDPDRFKTIKIARKPKNGVIEYNAEPTTSYSSTSSASASSDSILMQQKRDVNHQGKNHSEEFTFKKPVPSKLSKFGFSKPTDISRNDWKYSHKASSIDNLDNRNQKSSLSNIGSSSSSNMSTLGVKSKSINNLMNSNNFGYAGSRNDLKNNRNYSKYQNNGNNAASNNIDQSQNHQSISTSRSNMVVPSSGYYRGDSNRRAENNANDYHGSNENVMMSRISNKHSASNNNCEGISKLKQPGNVSRLPTGLRQPSGIPRTSVISALPRPSTTKR